MEKKTEKHNLLLIKNTKKAYLYKIHSIIHAYIRKITDS